jgi:hypothetical protein
MVDFPRNVGTYLQTTRRHISETRNLNTYRRENLRSQVHPQFITVFVTELMLAKEFSLHPGFFDSIHFAFYYRSLHKYFISYMKVEAVYCSKALVPSYFSIRCHNPKYWVVNLHYCGNFGSCRLYYSFNNSCSKHALHHSALASHFVRFSVTVSEIVQVFAYLRVRS